MDMTRYSNQTNMVALPGYLISSHIVIVLCLCSFIQRILIKKKKKSSTWFSEMLSRVRVPFRNSILICTKLLLG